MRIVPVILLIAFLAACSESSDPTEDTVVDTIVDTTTDPTDALDTTEVIDAPDATDPASEDGPRDTIGMICDTDEECQNGLYCDGEEICPYGFCQHGERVTCNDGVNCTIDTCIEETDSCDNTVSTEACDDSDPCTDDTCDVSTDSCVYTPIDCSDSVNCTLDTCDSTTGDCEHTISDLACDDSDACTIDTCDVSSDTCSNALIDGDGDLHPPESCGGDDCDDTDDTIYTGAPEVCEDGIDQDCDGADAPAGGCSCPVTSPLNSVTTADTTTGTGTMSGTCDVFGMSGNEIAHRLDLTASTDVYVIHYSDAMLGVMYILDGSCTGAELACEAGFTVGISSTLSAGTYFIMVDEALSGISGAYSLLVREDFAAVTVTGNDTCSAAHTISADGTWTGDNSTMTDTAVGSCGSTGTPGGRDAWFSFTLSAAADVHLDTFGSDHDTLLYVRTGSCTGTEVDCSDDAGMAFESTLDLSLSAGTYYVAVDTPGSTTSGTYRLTAYGL